MIDYVERGKNIKLLRRSQGISVEKASLDAPLSETRWKQLEAGQRNINTTFDTMQRIAHVLNVELLVLEVFSRSDEEIRAMVSAFPNAPQQSTTDIHPGSNILWLRDYQKMTQKRLAADSDMSTARLRDIEHCTANPTIKYLERIANALGVSLFTLYALTVPEQAILDMVHAARKLVTV